ncbi:MAG: hypothetical protein B6A08_00395 [Sorangiineae bacterium NIC37A_2]|jgi:predicted RND superfamily exporter protein|nr:MAG: hypothetical protein B6A08_00395 [Sorangiineae bacterium NIC37A_2]
MFESVARLLTSFSVKRPWIVTGLLAVIMTIGALFSTKLELRLNYMELLPPDAQLVKDFKWVMKKAGTEGYLVIALSGGSREERLEFAPTLQKAIEELPEVRYAEYTNDVPFFKENAGALLPLDEVKRIQADLEAKIKQGIEDSMDLGLDEDEPPKKVTEEDIEKTFAEFDRALPPEILENKEKTELYLMAKPALASVGVEEVTQLLESAESVCNREIQASGKPFRAEFGGPAVFMKTFNDGMQKDLGLISLVAFLAATFLLVASTRRPLASLFILLPIAGAIACALGVAAVTIGHLNIISSMLVAILLGLGVEFGIHLILRTNEARVQLPLEEALLEAVPETMAGAFSGAVTNGAAFFVLIFASFSAYRQFGFIAATGILLSWLFTYTLLPALIVITERYLPGWVIRADRAQETKFMPPRPLLWGVLIIFPLIAALGIYAIPRVGLERSFNALNGTTVPDPVGSRASSSLGTTLTPAFIWVPTLDDARKLEAIFEDLKKNDPNPNGSIIESTVSLARAVHNDWDERGPALASIVKSLRKLPDDLWQKYEARLSEFERAAQAKPLQVSDLPETVRRKFAPLDNDGTFVLFTPSRSVDDANELDDFVAKIELAVDQAKAMGFEPKVMSENRIAVHIFRQVFADAPFIGWSATLVALLVLFILLRDVRETLTLFAPLALGMLSMVAGLYLLKVKLNFINMCVIPSIFTVAIDNAVHLYHRYQKDGVQKMPQILGTTGIAILMASLVNLSGYAPMLLAQFYGLKSLGIVATLGMAGMVIATVAWFPALLLLIPERYIRGKRIKNQEG